MPTKDPKLWTIVGGIAALISALGTGGINWALYDPVLTYRIEQCEVRGTNLRDDITIMKSQIGALPPKYWRDKIAALEKGNKMLSDALIRLENHGHPELRYKQTYPK